MRLVLALGLTLAAAPAMAQPAPVAPAVAAPDPARLAAAREVVDAAMPPASREAMLAQIVGTFLDNTTRNVTEMLEFKEASATDQRTHPIFDRYLEKARASTIAYVQTKMPIVFEAMAKAYARRFTLRQLAELKGFFETPTGRLYMAQQGTILSDHDVAAAQLAIMTSQPPRIDTNGLFAEIRALPPVKPGG